MADPGRPHTGYQGALAAIPKWSIEHPWVLIAFYTGVVILSILTLGFYMPRRFMPYVESPVIGVFTMMPGLSAQEVELYLSNPIEQQMTNIRNVRYIRSTSQDGFSVVSLEFQYGADMKKALFDVQSLMNLVASNLPASGANLKPSWVLAIDPLNIPILTLSATNPSWDQPRLRQFLDNDVVSRLKQEVPNVYSVMSFGGYRRQLQVLVDRNQLAAHGMSILNVRDAIDRYNVARPGGTLTHGDTEGIARLDTHAQDAATVAEYPVTAGPAPGGSGSPRVVHVKDLAQVLDTFWERRSAYHLVKHDPGTAGEIVPALEVAVVQNPEASSFQVIGATRKVLARLEAENPGRKFTTAYDNAHFVGILFHNLLVELGVAVLLAAIVIFFFLGEWRGTVIALFSIPASLAMAILLLVPMGMTLNSGTLIGLLLSIGRLVDDTIIDVHAVERHLRMGKTP